MSEHFDDSELGFVDAALSVAKGIGGVFKKIGSAVKKKKAKKKAKAAAKKDPAGAAAKKAAPKGKVIQMDPTDIVGDVIKGAAAAAKSSGATITPESLSKEVAATVPPLVRQQVLEAIKDNKAANLSKADNIASVASQVDDAIKPHVAAMLATLEAQQLSRQATFEHESLKARDDFRSSAVTKLDQLSLKLDELAASHNQVVSSLKLGNVAIVRKKLPIFGPKNVLEG